MADPFGNARIGTLFAGKHYAWFDWSTMKLVPGPGALGLFELPPEIDEINAACINPLDWDIVWLFRRDKVVDWSVSRRRCLRRGRLEGGVIVTDVVTAIKDHPVFSLLPAAMHVGIDAIYTGDPRVDPAAAPWLVVVGTGRQVKLKVSSLYRAWVLSTGDGPGDTRCILNGAGSRAGQVFTLRDGDPKCTVTDPQKPAAEEDVRSLFGGFNPKAAVPVQVEWPGPWDVPAASEGTSTHDTVTVLPPDVLHVWGDDRGKAPAAAGQTRAFLDGLPKGSTVVDANARKKELAERNLELFERLAQGRDIPDFLRTFVAVPISGAVSGVKYEIVFYAAPDFLAVGSDFEWFRVPLSVPAGQWILDLHGCLHPTKPMARAVYEATPPAQRIPYRGDWMTRSTATMGGPTSTQAFVEFHEQVRVQQEQRGYGLGRLTAGLMKDVIISSEQRTKPSDNVFFWGGVFANGEPAEPAGASGEAFHPAIDHDEYAMGLRMCHGRLFLRKAGAAWEQKRVADVLADEVTGFVLRADNLNGRAPFGFAPILSPRYRVVGLPPPPYDQGLWNLLP